MTEIHPIVAFLRLSPEQQRAVVARHQDVAVSAGAGTGKTRTLVARYLSLLAGGLPLRRIVAVTFTRKAAREMRNRVRQVITDYLATPELSEAEQSRWRAHHTALDAARIGTIHNLCLEILRAHPAEVGVDPRFTVLDETQAQLMLARALDTAMAWAAEDETAVQLYANLGQGTLRQALDAMMSDRLEAAAAARAALAGSAGDRLAEWQARIDQARAEAWDRLTGDSDWQAAIEILRRNVPQKTDDYRAAQRGAILAAVETAAGHTAVSDKIRELSLAADINLGRGSASAWPDGKPQADEVKSALRVLRDMWRKQAANLTLALNGLDELLLVMMPLLAQVFAQAEESYRAMKEELHALDFDDLEQKAIELLAGYAEVRRRWVEEVDAMLVDEFQDTNQRQLDLIRLLCPEPDKLFIVGDAKQSIYRFRKADVTVFRREQAAISAAGGTIEDLDTSYRAHRQLVDGMNDLLGPVMGQQTAQTRPFEAPFAPLVPARPDAAAGLAAPFIELHLAVGSKAQGALHRSASALVARLHQLAATSDLSYGDMAILCRASGSFGAYEDALDSAGIPFMTVAGKGFYDRPEIRDLLNSLQAAADPNDDLALAGFLRSPAGRLSDYELYQLNLARESGQSLWHALQHQCPLTGEAGDRAAEAAALMHELSLQAGRTAVADLLKAFLDETGCRAALRQAGLHRAARNVAKLLTDAHNSGLVGAGAFLEYVANLKDSGSREGEARATADQAVQIMSVHAAKGLEFPLVVLGDIGYQSRTRRDPLIDPAWGVLINLKDDADETPASYRLCHQLETEKDKAEDKRLLYVAATRAREMLLLSGVISLSGSMKPSRLSGWLAQLGGVVGLSGAELSDYDEAGSRALTRQLAVGQTAVSLTVYEPEFQGTQASAAAAVLPHPRQTVLPPPLLAPLQVQDGTAEPEKDRSHKVWQVVPKSRQLAPPAWIIGRLVHESLAWWRFPGDAGFEPWLRALAKGFGLADQQRLDQAARETSRLLARFKQHRLWQRMNRAERRLHEIPYVLDQGVGVERGVIDALFLENGQWLLVDFKSDRLRSAAFLDEHIRSEKYDQQLARYRQAVQQLMGVDPGTILCLLNVGHEIHLVENGRTAA